MRFTVENQLDQFVFKDAELLAFELQENIRIELGAPIAKGTNPQNEEFVDRYIETMELQFMGANIKALYKEGYKYYDANDVLQEEVPDQLIAPMEYDAIIKKCIAEKSYLFHIEETKKEEDAYEVRLYIDVEVGDQTDTYLMDVTFNKSIASWDYFQNRVQY